MSINQIISSLIIYGIIISSMACAVVNDRAAATATITDTNTATATATATAAANANTPNLSYAGATGTQGVVNLAILIFPTALATGGGLTSCGVKSGSANSSSFPSSLKIDPNTCVIAGTPTAALASTQFTIEAANRAGTYSALVSIFVDTCNVKGIPFGGGDGSSGNPYQVCSIAHLQNMQNDLNASFQLRHDLNLSTVSNWTPIGTSANSFTGSFDGNNFTISNLTINLPSTDNVGLFGYMNGNNTLQNLTLANVQVVGNSYVGALVGRITSGTTTTAIISGIKASGSITGQGSSVGGLCGAGAPSRLLDIKGCSSSITVLGGGGDVGGIIGGLNNGTVTTSHTTGPVTCTGSAADCNVGGLVGNLKGSAGLMTSYATGAVTGYAAVAGSVGGVVGFARGGGGRGFLENSYAKGAVTGSVGSVANVGGLLGQASFVSNLIRVDYSYSTGVVSGSGTLGGLVGASTGGGNTATSAYWNTVTSGQTSSALGTAKTTEELQTQATFVGWLWSRWSIPSSGVYPTLK